MGKIGKFLIFGLELPILVIIGLYIGFLFGENLNGPWTGVFTLVGAFIGLIIGSIILWWVAIKMYRTNKSSIKSSSSHLLHRKF